MNYAKAIELFRQAQFFLGVMCRNGEGVPRATRRRPRGTGWRPTTSSETRRLTSGPCTAMARGFALSNKAAAELFRQAADQSFDKAAISLERMYHHGEGLAQSNKAAAAWCRLARPTKGTERRKAHLRDPVLHRRGGSLEQWGACHVVAAGGRPREFLRARRITSEPSTKTRALNSRPSSGTGWRPFKEICVRRSTLELCTLTARGLAQHRLGTMHSSGQGGATRLDEEAMKWYRLAADQCDASAQHCVGGMYYFEGPGVAQSDEESKK